MKRFSAAAVVAVVTCLVGVGFASAASITIKSGNAPIGQQDPNVRITALNNFGLLVPNSTAVPYPAWVVSHPLYTVIPGTNYVGFNNWSLGPTTGGAGPTVFETSFRLPDNVTDVSLQLTTRADNGITISLNGAAPFTGTAYAWPNVCGESLYGSVPALSFTVGSGFEEGDENTLAFTVDNCGGPGSTGLDFLGTVSYSLYPTDENECKNGNWRNLVEKDGKQFTNQGDCVSSVDNDNENDG
jgi:hypothetical protein